MTELTKLDFEITSNWQINNNQKLCNTITTITLSKVPDRIDLEEVVSLETCVSLKSPENDNDPCSVEIKLKNCQRISRIAVVSEACVLEFFKDSGEYATTVFAELFDDFQDNSVYFADTLIEPPAKESSIKFTKTKSRGPVFWIYGIRLILTEPSPNNEKETLACLVENFFSRFDKSKESLPKTEGTDAATTALECLDSRDYVDNQIKQMEERLMQKLNRIEENMNEKFDLILRKFDSQSNIVD